MEDIELYNIIKILHIISLISWLAGLLYLPRIFVYHTQVKIGSESDKIFQIMERRLIRFIMMPAMILTFLSGFYLASEIGFGFAWLHIKITLALILAGFHGALSRYRKNFENGTNKNSQKFFRIINEVPTLLMIVIVALVILKPF
jgi:putative membrane protein